jgi:hypothetical protein
MDLGNLNKKISVNLVYTPTQPENNQTAAPIIISIGEGKNQISMDLLGKIIQYARSGNDTSSASFQDILAEAMYKGLSSNEKQIIKALKTDKDGIANSQLVIQEEDESIDNYSVVKGVPTQEYLDDLKMMEEIYNKTQDLVKFHKKMDKISGNLPLDEMFQDVSGTGIRLSNLHISDFSRLNDLKIHSTVFA